MYSIQETKKGDFIVRGPGPGRREMFRGTEVEAQNWIDQEQAKIQGQAEQATNQESYDNSVPDLNAAQIRWQKWRSWFYNELQREARRVNQMRGALDRLDSNLPSYSHHEQGLTEDQENLTKAESLYSRAVYLDSRIKTARRAKNTEELTGLLAVAEQMIEEMDNYFTWKARPSEDKPRQSGTKPNASIVLTDKELDFINQKYEGSKSMAIHEGLQRLMSEQD